MAEIRPFCGIRYGSEFNNRLSDLIAPPYDVLDDAGKAALQKRHANNIVGIDLPHMPPKTVGPDSAYEAANRTLKQWIEQGVLAKDREPAFYAYAQTYSTGGRTYNRRGFFTRVKLSPFGQGEVVPHEKTYPDAIADRLKLTRATRVQMSPIFGLFSDAENQVNAALFGGLKGAESTATLDGVTNELWKVVDAGVQKRVTELMAKRPIYIADGHHRYTMALQYQKEQGAIPAGHAANFALFVLVAMQDPGLVILPTHRIIGGMAAFDPAVMIARLGGDAELKEISGGAAEYAAAILPGRPKNTFGLYDGKTRKLYELRIIHPDILKQWEPKQSEALRSLDVSILQRFLLEEIIGPTFAPGRELTKAYTADAKSIEPMTDGTNRQIALILKSTPLTALEELGRHNEVMPQKSTYFFPKLATGMVINGVDSAGSSAER